MSKTKTKNDILGHGCHNSMCNYEIKLFEKLWLSILLMTWHQDDELWCYDGS